MATVKDLNGEQAAAIVAFAMDNGRTWKEALRTAWMNGKCSGPLQEIRNAFGPSWLAAFTWTRPAPPKIVIVRFDAEWSEFLAEFKGAKDDRATTHDSDWESIMGTARAMAGELGTVIDKTPKRMRVES